MQYVPLKIATSNISKGMHYLKKNILNENCLQGKVPQLSDADLILLEICCKTQNLRDTYFFIPV